VFHNNSSKIDEYFDNANYLKKILRERKSGVKKTIEKKAMEKKAMEKKAIGFTSGCNL